MKKTVLALTIGMMIGLLAGSLSGAFAAVGDKVEAVFTEYNFIVDGERVELDVLPVAINDSAYLPLRAFANMLGFNVTWHADSWTIELTTPAKGAEKMNGTPVPFRGPTVEKQIEWVERDIANQEQMIRSNELMLTDGALSDSLRAEIQSYIDEAKAKITELQAKKAELEAQLQAAE